MVDTRPTARVTFSTRLDKTVPNYQKEGVIKLLKNIRDNLAGDNRPNNRPNNDDNDNNRTNNDDNDINRPNNGEMIIIDQIMMKN